MLQPIPYLVYFSCKVPANITFSYMYCLYWPSPSRCGGRKIHIANGDLLLWKFFRMSSICLYGRAISWSSWPARDTLHAKFSYFFSIEIECVRVKDKKKRQYFRFLSFFFWSFCWTCISSLLVEDQMSIHDSILSSICRAYFLSTPDSSVTLCVTGSL